MDLFQGIKNILKSSAALKSLSKVSPKQWPTVKLVLSKIENESSSKVYQGATLSRFNDKMVSRCADLSLVEA